MNLCKGYWKIHKEKWELQSAFSRKLDLNLDKNVEVSIFLKREGKDFRSQISIKFAFTYTKANTFGKDLKNNR